MKKQEQNINKRGNFDISIKKEGEMASLWNRILLGFAGGILVMGGVWGFSVYEGNTKFLMLIPIIFGILAIFYARNI